MTKYHTQNPIGSVDPRDLYDNAQNLDAAVNDTKQVTWVDRLGRRRMSYAGIEHSAAAVLASLGYAVPVPYEAGLVMDSANQTVHYEGQAYAPSFNQIPFTTSGTFEADKFRLIQGVSGADLAAGYGAAMVGFSQEGDRAVTLDVRKKLREISMSTSDFPSLSDAIDAAIVQQRVVTLYENTTVRIPSDAPTLQSAIDHLKADSAKIVINLQIESGHQPALGVRVVGGDYGAFQITSADSEVVLPPSFGTTAEFLYAENAVAPVLKCLIDANSQVSVGARYTNGAYGLVAPGCGVKNAWGSGLSAFAGSTVIAIATIWTGCVKAPGGTGSGMTAWASTISAEESDVSNSGYYGAQAAAGGTLNFRAGKANNCAAYGVRATNAGKLSAPYVQANDCTLNGIRAFDGGIVEARFSEAMRAGRENVSVSGGGYALVSDSNLSGSKGDGILVTNATVVASGSNISGSAKNGIMATSASVSANACNVSNSGESGVRAAGASTVSARALIAPNCFKGVYAESGSSIDATGANCTGARSVGVEATGGSTVDATNVTATGSSIRGVYSRNCSRINLTGGNARKGSVDSTEDIYIAWGGVVEATGATGGLRRPANAIFDDGIIFKT